VRAMVEAFAIAHGRHVIPPAMRLVAAWLARRERRASRRDAAPLSCSWWLLVTRLSTAHTEPNDPVTLPLKAGATTLQRRLCAARTPPASEAVAEAILALPVRSTAFIWTPKFHLALLTCPARLADTLAWCGAVSTSAAASLRRAVLASEASCAQAVSSGALAMPAAQIGTVVLAGISGEAAEARAEAIHTALTITIAIARALSRLEVLDAVQS